MAENGTDPPIFIYKYPEMSLISTCENGTKQTFTCINFNSTGEMMVSQGGSPDYTLTIWNWKTSSVILRSQSFHSDVYNVVFSEHNSEQLITGGVGHIKFWNMSKTFTGLKLNSYPGRFGRAEACDVTGICAMPDRKILSNSEWGSILVWAGGHIKFEVCQKNRMPCHKISIAQIIYKDGNVMTIGRDGFVRVWFWKTIELDDPDSCEQPFIEVDPTFEYRIGTDDHVCDLLSLVNDPDVENCWYAQDGNGGIWKCPLVAGNDEEKSTLLFRCHAGGIIGLGACPFSAHIVTLGIDGRAHLYNYETSELLCFYQFPAGGRQLLWVPKNVGQACFHRRFYI